MSDVVGGMVVGAFGLVGTLASLCVSWLRDRDAVSQRSKQLEEATKRIQFWDQWLKLSTTVDDAALDLARKRVQQELATLCQILGGESASFHQEISQQQSKVSAFQEKLHKLSFLRHTLLLYRPARQLAWVPRIFFFFFILEAIFIPFMSPSDTFSDRFAGVFGCAILVLIFWLLARWAERPRKTASIATTGIPAPPPC